MSKNKSKNDYISEEEFSMRMRGQDTSPEEDSPGDSESDAGSEFLMGLNYLPGERNESDTTGEEPGEVVFADADKPSPEDAANNSLPRNARVVFSDQPSPASDLDSASDTH